MRQLFTVRDRVRRSAVPLAAVLLLGCYPGVLLAASGIGLPYAVVPVDPDQDKHWEPDVEVYPDLVAAQEQGYVEIAADPVKEWELRDVEIAAGPVVEWDESDVEIAAGPVIVLSMVEVPPDPFSGRYRSGIDVYRSMSEHGFDNEPMLVVYAQADPAMAQPGVVVIQASIDPSYNHITAAQQIVDPIARGEDRIHLAIFTRPAEERSPLPLKPPRRRFFSQKQEPDVGF